MIEHYADYNFEGNSTVPLDYMQKTVRQLTLAKIIFKTRKIARTKHLLCTAILFLAHTDNSHSGEVLWAVHGLGGLEQDQCPGHRVDQASHRRCA